MASFKARSDSTTSLEVAVWANVHNGPNGEYTQYSLTVSRSWKDKEGQWHQGGAYRVHDIPVFHFLLTSAYSWAVGQRTEIRIDDECPI